MDTLSLEHSCGKSRPLAISRVIDRSTRAVTNTVDYFVFFQSLEDSLSQWRVVNPQIYLYGKNSTPLGKLEGLYKNFREKNRMKTSTGMNIIFSEPNDGLDSDPDYIPLRVDGHIIGGAFFPGLSQLLGDKSTSIKKDIKDRISNAFESFVKLASTHLDLQLASFDPLTGLNNRRSGTDKITKKIDELRGANSPTGTVALIDIDDFKKINDTYGHNIGDQVLVYIAQVIKSTVERLMPDAVDMRFGGEEVVIYFPTGTTNDIKYIILAILKIISTPQTAVKIDGESFPFTASVGTSVTDSWALDMSVDSILDSMIQEADKAMYHVKNSGKDGVIEFHPSMLEGGSKYVRG